MSEYRCRISSMTACGSGRPLTTLRRYSGICSRVSGVPWASSRTACLAIHVLQPELAHHAHDGLHVFNWSGGNNAVAEVEDVAGTAVGGAKNFLHAQFQHFGRRKERDGVQVALHSVAVADGAPALVERLPPVETYNIGAGCGHLAQQTACLHAKIDHRHTHLLHGAHQAFRSLKS